MFNATLKPNIDKKKNKNHFSSFEICFIVGHRNHHHASSHSTLDYLNKCLIRPPNVRYNKQKKCGYGFDI